MKRTITIFEDDQSVMVFPAPDDKYMARSLWVFLVDNLRPGFIVHLSIDEGSGEVMPEIARPSGQQVPTALRRKLMETDKLTWVDSRG